MNGNLQTNTCDADRLESYLNGELSEMQELEFTAHLDQCEACRSSLELRAADPESWSEAEQLLKPLRLGAEHLVPPRSQAPQIQQVLDALAPTDDPAMLGRLGGYEVSGVVGAGGMGVVLKAVDKSLDRTVAIKVMSPHLATSGAARKRFAREAKAAAAVLHPNVIAIHSVSNDETLPYLVMPYVRGAALQKRLDAEGPLALNEILRIGSQIAAGLSAAHAQGLVHRDIKPANILLEDGIERVAITDFGLARAVDDATITRSGVIAGTPQYMSPEQARGESIDQRSDLFSLGSVLYAICTGRPPFRAETTFGVMRRITDDEPKSIREINPDIPDWLCVIIKRLMSKRAADRFASAEEVQELLEQCLAHVQQPDSVPLPESLVPQPSGVGSFFRSHRTGVIAMLGAFGFSLLGMLFWQGTEPPDIAGTWTGDEWGTVVLEEKRPGQYEGTYTETVKDTPGTIRVRWSRIERRYNGTWSEGDDRFGKISVRLVDDEIRGGWTTNRKSEINPGTPELANLSWKRTDTSKPLASMTEIVADSAIPTVQELIASVVEVDLQRAPNASGMRFEKGSVVVLTGLITRKKDLQLRGFELQRMELMDKPAEPGPARSWDTLEIQDSIKVLQEAIDLEIDRLPAELMDSAVTSPLPRLKQGEWPDAVVHPQLRNTLKALNDPPEDTVQLRYLDFDVKPNCFYRYRVRLEYNNPDYDMTVDQLSDQTISSDWSKPTKLVPKSAPENQRTDHGKRSLEDTSKQLDGLWRVVESQKGSSADFTGKRKTLSPKGIDFLEFRASAPMPNVSTIRIEECMTDLLHIEIDPQTDPPSIDVVWFHKAFGEQGQILQDESELISIGIFEATEDELKILLVPYNSALTKDQRPKSFSLNGNLTGALYRLKRYVAPPERQEITGRWNVVSAIHDGRNITEEFEEGILSFSSLTFAAQSKPNFVARSWGYYQLTTDSHPAEITFITHDYGFWKGPMGREPSEQFEKKPDWNGIYRFETKDGDAIPHNASNSAEREQPKPSRLRIAFRSGGPRPESFKSEPDSGVTLLELERQPNREQENLATYPEQYKRLIEQRQYKTAAELALEARELAPDESARQLWSLKSKFAKQLEQTEAGSGEEQELRELLKFPLHPIVDPQVPHVVSPPTPIEVIRELERNQGLKENSLTDSYERNADNFRVIVEPVYDKVDPPRFLPLVGRASLHRVRFKCTVYYTQANEEISKVFNIDRDHLHVIESEIKATTSRRNGEQPPVDFPAPPVYGGRNPKTGDAELNPAWANPVRRMLVKTNEIESGARVPTEPSSRNSPTKLPDGLTKEARYCLLKLGDQKQTDIWLIQDRDWLYVDLNGDGDLSSPDERFVEKEEQGFSIPELTSRGYVIPPSLQSDPEVRGYFPLRLSWQKTGEQNLWVRLFVENKYWQESIISASATKPELAPILHFDGPLRYFLLHPTSRFTVGETPLSMAVAIGTVSETGDITYVDLDEPPLEGKVISDLTVRYYATVDSEPREIETNGLTPDGYGGHLISTLKTTDDMQSGKIEIEVRSPEDSRLPVAPLKSRIPLVKSKAAPTDSSP